MHTHVLAYLLLAPLSSTISSLSTLLKEGLSPHTHLSVKLNLHIVMRLLALVIAASVSCVHSIPQNVTVDDFYGDPVTGMQFNYVGPWNVGQTCSGCGVQPDRSQMYNGTWHDSTTDPGGPAIYAASITFSGRLPRFVPSMRPERN